MDEGCWVVVAWAVMRMTDKQETTVWHVEQQGKRTYHYFPVQGVPTKVLVPLVCFNYVSCQT
jgi:hypothetical protein